MCLRLCSRSALLLIAGEYELITVVPDDSTALVALQAVTGFAAGLGASSVCLTDGGPPGVLALACRK